MTESNNFTAVSFFKCLSPINKLVGGSYHDAYEHVGDTTTYHRCYMRKFNKDELELCFKGLKENSDLFGATCSYTGKENLS
jgi:hypothetical protein